MIARAAILLALWLPTASVAAQDAGDGDAARQPDAAPADAGRAAPEPDAGRSAPEPDTDADAIAEPDTSANEEEARALFIAGRAAFERGEFERALDHFTHAYELSQRPGLLFNIGNTHDRLRHDREALDYLSRYLDANPDAENADFVGRRVEVLRENLAARDAVEAERARTDEAHAAERERLIAAAEAVDATPSDAGIGLMIGGGVGLLATIPFAIWWAQTSNSLNNCMPRTGCDPRPIAGRQDAASALTISVAVVSAAALGVGVVLFAISPRPEGSDDEHPAAALRCGLGAGHVACQGAF